MWRSCGGPSSRPSCAAKVATNILLNLNLVGMGLGYALLPAYVSSLTSSAICTRPLEGEPPTIDLLMVSRKEPHAAELEALFELVRETRP